MWELLKDLIQSQPGSIGFYFAVTLIIAWLLVFVTKKITKITTEHGFFNKTLERIENKFDKQFEKIENQFEKQFERIENKFDRQFEKVDKRFEKVDKRFEKVEVDIIEVKTDIIEVKKGLNLLNILIEPFIEKKLITEKNSPLKLTQLGKDIAEEFGLKTIVDFNWNKISDHLKSKNLTHPYDIEQYCLNVTMGSPEKILSEMDMFKLKNIAFRGTYHLIQLTEVIAVLILERYYVENNIETNL